MVICKNNFDAPILVSHWCVRKREGCLSIWEGLHFEKDFKDYMPTSGSIRSRDDIQELFFILIVNVVENLQSGFL